MLWVWGWSVVPARFLTQQFLFCSFAHMPAATAWAATRPSFCECVHGVYVCACMRAGDSATVWIGHAAAPSPEHAFLARGVSCRRASARVDNNVYKKFFQDFVQNSVATNLPDNVNSSPLDFDMASATTADDVLSSATENNDHHYKLSVASSDSHTGDQVCGYAEPTAVLILASERPCLCVCGVWCVFV